MRFTGFIIILIFISSFSYSSIKKSVEVQIFNKSVCKKVGLLTDEGRNCYYIKHKLYSLNDKELELFIKKSEKALSLIPAEHVKSVDDINILKQESPILVFSIIDMIKGEKCLISGLPLDPDKDVVLMVKGRRYPYKKEALPIVIANPEKHLGKLQPKGALFHEPMGNEGILSKIWLYFGIYFLIGIIFAGLCTQKAIKNNRPLLTWFFAGLFLNITAYIVILLTPPNPEPEPVVEEFKTSQPVICPSCGCENHPSVQKCYQCSSRLKGNE